MKILEIVNEQIADLEFALAVVEQNLINFKNEKDTYKEFYLQKTRGERSLEILNQIKQDLEVLEIIRNKMVDFTALGELLLGFSLEVAFLVQETFYKH